MRRAAPALHRFSRARTSEADGTRQRSHPAQLYARGRTRSRRAGGPHGGVEAHVQSVGGAAQETLHHRLSLPRPTGKRLGGAGIGHRRVRCGGRCLELGHHRRSSDFFDRWRSLVCGGHRSRVDCRHRSCALVRIEVATCATNGASVEHRRSGTDRTHRYRVGRVGLCARNTAQFRTAAAYGGACYRGSRTSSPLPAETCRGCAWPTWCTAEHGYCTALWMGAGAVLVGPMCAAGRRQLCHSSVAADHCRRGYSNHYGPKLQARIAEASGTVLGTHCRRKASALNPVRPPSGYNVGQITALRESLAHAVDCVGALEKVATFPASTALPAHAPVP